MGFVGVGAQSMPCTCSTCGTSGVNGEGRSGNTCWTGAPSGGEVNQGACAAAGGTWCSGGACSSCNNGCLVAGDLSSQNPTIAYTCWVGTQRECTDHGGQWCGSASSGTTSWTTKGGMMMMLAIGSSLFAVAHALE